MLFFDFWFAIENAANRQAAPSTNQWISFAKRHHAAALQPKEAAYYNNRAAAYLMLTKVGSGLVLPIHSSVRHAQSQSALEDTKAALVLDPSNAKVRCTPCRCPSPTAAVPAARMQMLHAAGRDQRRAAHAGGRPGQRPRHQRAG